MFFNKNKADNKNRTFLEPEPFSLNKRIIFFIIGVFGLYAFSTISSLIVNALPISGSGSINGAMQFITYSFMLVAFLLVIFNDLLPFIKAQKHWENYLIGLVFGIGMLVFSIVYSNIVGFFYKTDVNDNEKALRSFITVYPILSIIFLCFIGPFCEELTYRVGLFGSLKNYKVVAYIAAVAIFAFMHFDFASKDIVNEFINLPSYLISATLLAVAYDKFGFSASLSAHILNNLFSVISVIIVANI